MKHFSKMNLSFIEICVCGNKHLPEFSITPHLKKDMLKTQSRYFMVFIQSLLIIIRSVSYIKYLYGLRHEMLFIRWY